MLRLTPLAPAVVANLLANPDVAINLEGVLRRVMPLDWRAQGAVFAGRYSQTTSQGLEFASCEAVIDSSFFNGDLLGTLTIMTDLVD